MIEETGKLKLILTLLPTLSNYLQQPKTHAVVRAWPVCPDGITVLPGGVAGVFFPAILRKFGGQYLHMLVAESFGQNGRCCNAAVESVAPNYAGMRNALHRPKTVAINQQVRGGYGQGGYGPVHGQVAGLCNVELLNFGY